MSRAIILCVMLLCVCSVAVIALAQPPDTLWTRTFGGSSVDRGRSVQQTTDGGYVITGSSVVSGAGEQVYLIKTDAGGNIVFERTFGGSNNDVGYSVQQISGGGYVIAGATNSYGAGNSDFYLIKTNSVGDTIWTRTYGGSNIEQCYGMQQTSDSGYIISGSTFSYGAGVSDFFLVKTDAAGNMLWQHTYGGSNVDTGCDVRQTPDGGFIFVGYTASFGAGNYDVYLIKTDAAGNLVWQNTFGGTSSDCGWSVQQTFGGGFIIVGDTPSFGAGNYDVYLIKTDAEGNLLWQSTFGGIGGDFGRCVQQVSDGGYAITGYTSSFGAGLYDVYLLKADATGNLIWQCTFGGSNFDYGYDVQQTVDNGFVIVGETNSFSAGDYDIYLIKTNASSAPLDITTAPINPPIIIPANGGSFQYYINIHNQTTSPQTFSFWNKVRNAANNYTTVFGPITRTLIGGANPTRTLTQTISGSISSGTLYFISYVGTFPSTVVDSSYFTITKSATGDGGPWITESSCSGDFFDEFASQDNPPVIPNSSFLIHNCVPNPFNPTTTIRFELPMAALVTFEVFDINGRRVGVGLAPTRLQGAYNAPLQEALYTSGTHEIQFDGSNLPSGIYIYRLTAGSQQMAGKMVLLK